MQDALQVTDRIRYTADFMSEPCSLKIGASPDQGGCDRQFSYYSESESRVRNRSPTEYDILINRADQLEDDLLIIHGTVDDVVVWQHSQSFLKACVDNEVQLDYFVYPGHPHNVRGKDRFHLMEKVLNYVDEKLN